MPSSQLDAVAMDTSLALHQLVKAQVDVRWSSSSFRMNFVPDTPIHTHLLVDIGFCCPIYLRQQAKTTRSSPFGRAVQVCWKADCTWTYLKLHTQRRYSYSCLRLGLYERWIFDLQVWEFSGVCNIYQWVWDHLCKPLP